MAKPNLMSLAQMQPGDAVNVRFQLVFDVTNKAMQFPPFDVPPGASVTLRSINGSAINAAGCSIGEYPEQVNRNGALFLPPGADVAVPWPVDNTCEIWAAGQAKDGLMLMIQKSMVG